MKMVDKIRVLLADDDPVLLRMLPTQLSSESLEISTTDKGQTVLDVLRKKDFDVILLDVNLPDMSGVEVLSKIQQTENAPEVIMLTADKSLATGVQAMRLGAYDYITKPARADEVEAVVRKAFEKHILVRQNERLQVAARQQTAAVGIQAVHTTPAMEKIFSQAERIADLDTTLLITGESGTGKDVLARWIHCHSSRSEYPLISINCGALPENLFESELFGHEKGAFTGADKRKIGLVEAADNSTLFLDEIGEMPLPMQVKLLHFLENNTFRRVGSTRDHQINVRVIAATNKNLPEEIRDKNFRADLFYRLNVISFEIPSLRERPDDIQSLADFFLESLSVRYRRPHLKLSKSARRQLQDHRWYGNVRELKNSLERTVALSTEDTINEIYGLVNQIIPNSVTEPVFVPISLAELEKQHILKVLETVEGNREKAASILRITSRTLYRKLKEYKV
jgi:DNA-binding NtrC family response regulator